MTKEQREIFAGLSPAQKIVVLVIEKAQDHGFPGTNFEGLLEWLDQRLEASDQRVLKEAELEPDPLFSSSKQPERSGFARQLRARQERSAQQAMVIMANDLQRAYRTIEQLRQTNKELADGESSRR